MPEHVVEEVAWATALDRLQDHLDAIRGGLTVFSLPEPSTVALPDGPVPAALVARARRLLDEQRDLEAALRDRMGVVSAMLAGGFQPTPAPVFVDYWG
ncbi:MAG: hypothetical protein M0004_02620 [Actinomycetota bacterium]|nr:hypothetical protein [Actinomycetota bacterium]